MTVRVFPSSDEHGMALVVMEVDDEHDSPEWMIQALGTPAFAQTLQ